MTDRPLVGVIMGSESDWPTMRRAAEVLEDFGVPHECRVVSAHRTPDLMVSYAESASGRGLQAIIAGAGGAAHLPGMVAGHTIVPVIGVPIMSRALKGMDSLLSIVQMPAGVPVATMAIGRRGDQRRSLRGGRPGPQRSAVGGAAYRLPRRAGRRGSWRASFEL